DAYLGRGYYQNWLRFKMESSLMQNELYMNRGDRFERVLLEEVNGNTLSVVASDINMDGIPDLLIANDGDQPDEVMIGQPSGGFKRTTPYDGLIPSTPHAAMSYDTADFNNDLKFDI